jgi:hypothetical protein
MGSFLHQVVTILLVTTPIVIAAQAPTPMFERWLTVGSRTVRTSLFDNRVVVVSVRQDDEQVLLRQMELSRDEYIGYLAAVQRDADELATAENRLMTESMAGSGKIVIRIGRSEPLTVHYSPIAVLDLATSRLVAAIDDLERRVIWGPPPDTGLDGWQPRRGERVQLRTGVTARVSEVREDGTIVLEHEDVAILETVSPERRAAVILEVLEDGP